MKVPIAALAVVWLLGVALLGRDPRGNAADRPDEHEIRGLLSAQVSAWNRGDIETFMLGYWKSEETEFIGANGITRGWQAVLDRYRRAYPGRQAMGQLSFANLEVHVECRTSAYVVGEFHLERETEGGRQGEAGKSDGPSGVFTLQFRKFPEGWLIVSDHTTGYPAPAPSK